MNLVSYTKPTGEKDGQNAPIMEEKKVTVSHDLKVTLGEIGTHDFFTYMPVKYIEAFFKQIENDESADFRSYLNNFHKCFPGGYFRINKDILQELNDENSQKKLSVIPEIDLVLTDLHIDPKEIEQEVKNINASDKNVRNFYRKVRPVYIALRNKGYTHNDLRS